MGNHDRSFARLAASTHADHFGEGTESVPYETPQGTVVNLSHVVVADERRTWRKENFGTVLVMVRDGWAVTDPARPNYCGVTELLVGSTLDLFGLVYTIEAVHKGQHIHEFKAIRTGDVEVSSSGFRGR